MSVSTGTWNKLVAASEITDSDVLFGRGRGIQIHEGNLGFRQLVEERSQAYGENAHDKAFRRKAAMDIISIVKSSGGRFLKKLPGDRGGMGQSVATSGEWEVADLSTSITKVKQALRDTASNADSSQPKRISHVGASEHTTASSQAPDNQAQEDLSGLLEDQYQRNLLPQAMSQSQTASTQGQVFSYSNTRPQYWTSLALRDRLLQLDLELQELASLQRAKHLMPERHITPTELLRRRRIALLDSAASSPMFRSTWMPEVHQLPELLGSSQQQLTPDYLMHPLPHLCATAPFSEQQHLLHQLLGSTSNTAPIGNNALQAFAAETARIEWSLASPPQAEASLLRHVSAAAAAPSFLQASPSTKMQRNVGSSANKRRARSTNDASEILPS